ncbi:helix-turn-helix domain-containing protein [Chloroflexota bacterium]
MSRKMMGHPEKRKHDIRAGMLTTGEVACIFQVSPGTVRRWHNQGKLKAYRIGFQGQRRYLRRDVFLFYTKRSPGGKNLLK